MAGLSCFQEAAMDADGIGLFNLAERRLSWLDQRQALLAQNIANANTPGFQARDLSPFAQLVAGAGEKLSVTDPMHLAGAVTTGRASQERPRERAPDGNAVSVEEQLTKVADTEGAQSLTTNLMHKYLGLFRTVLGK